MQREVLKAVTARAFEFRTEVVPGVSRGSSGRVAVVERLRVNTLAVRCVFCLLERHNSAMKNGSEELLPIRVVCEGSRRRNPSA